MIPLTWCTYTTTVLPMNTYRVTITAESLNINETITVTAANEGQARGEAMIQRRKNGSPRIAGAHVTYEVEEVNP